ncbi:MAG: hypothetical protein ACRC68_12105 [Clostridium sp.]
MNEIENNLYSYFTNKDIKIVNKRFETRNSAISLENIKFQIDNVIKFQSLCKGYTDNILPRIGGSIGRDLESYKVQIKNLEIDIISIKNKSIKNRVDILLAEEGDKLLRAGIDAINRVENSGYNNIIRRSMRNYEICLGSVSENNLRVNDDGKIEVGTIKYLTYNLLEHDFYSYIKHLRKRNNKMDIDELIYYFVEKALLENNSIEYLKALLSYPIESLRLWDKYRRNKKELTQEQYIEGFYRAKRNDDNELIWTGGGLNE